MKQLHKIPKHKKGAWFVAIRGSYIPVSWKGWLSYVPFIGYLVGSLIVGFMYTGTDIKAVLWIVPNWVAAAVVMTWVAQRTS